MRGKMVMIDEIIIIIINDDHDDHYDFNDFNQTVIVGGKWDIIITMIMSYQYNCTNHVCLEANKQAFYVF